MGVLWLVPSDDYLFLPDPARPVDPLVDVPDERAVDEEGGIYMVDIVVKRARLFERLFPGLYDGSTLVPGDVYNPEGVPDRVRRQESLREMSTSQQIASAVALRALGYDVEPAGAEVVEVEAGSPADGALRVGDVIVEGRGRAVKTPEELIRAMAAVEPGERVDLRVERGGVARPVTVGTRASEDTPPRAVMGVRIQPELELPVDIEIDAGDIGGPSAGLAFALDISDELGSDIDDGRRIAATGELALDGRVLPIGGVKQKTFGARDVDANVFLVPDANAAEARLYADGLRIVPVSTFREALSICEQACCLLRQRTKLFSRKLRKTGERAASPPGQTLLSWRLRRMKKQAEISCSDCFFRRSDLCALAGNIPCPTFRHAKALEPPKQPRLVARQPLAAARAA